MMLLILMFVQRTHALWPLTGSSCPLNGFVGYIGNQHCYWLSADKMGGSSINETCASLHEEAFPVKMNSPTVAEVVHAILIYLSNQPVWVGLSDNHSEGAHVWNDGELLLWGNWHYNRPSDRPVWTKHCVQAGLNMYGEVELTDTYCNVPTARVVCEYIPPAIRGYRWHFPMDRLDLSPPELVDSESNFYNTSNNPQLTGEGYINKALRLSSSARQSVNLYPALSSCLENMAGCTEGLTVMFWTKLQVSSFFYGWYPYLSSSVDPAGAGILITYRGCEFRTFYSYNQNGTYLINVTDEQSCRNYCAFTDPACMTVTWMNNTEQCYVSSLDQPNTNKNITYSTTYKKTCYKRLFIEVSTTSMTWSTFAQVHNNSWFHVGVTWDPMVGLKVFINGVLPLLNNAPSPDYKDQFPNANLILGKAFSPSHNSSMFGQYEIDELRIWNQSLTPDLVRLDYLTDVTPCLDGWLGHSLICYLFYNPGGNLTYARDLCRATPDAGLATINTQKEADFISEVITLIDYFENGPAWRVGLVYVCGGWRLYPDPNGDSAWGGPLLGNEIKNSGVFRPVLKQLDSIEDSVVLPFICQYPASPEYHVLPREVTCSGDSSAGTTTLLSFMPYNSTSQFLTTTAEPAISSTLSEEATVSETGSESYSQGSFADSSSAEFSATMTSQTVTSESDNSCPALTPNIDHVVPVPEVEQGNAQPTTHVTVGCRQGYRMIVELDCDNTDIEYSCTVEHQASPSSTSTDRYITSSDLGTVVPDVGDLEKYVGIVRVEFPPTEAYGAPAIGIPAICLVVAELLVLVLMDIGRIGRELSKHFGTRSSKSHIRRRHAMSMST